jgi:uncharacterized membrane protein YfcA
MPGMAGMNTASLVWLLATFFLTAAISVVTGGTSLLTVPVMLALGIEPHAAVATNMFALIFLSLGGTLPFLNGNRLPRRRLPALVVLTLVGSALGAWLLVIVPSRAMPLVIATATLGVAAFFVTNRGAGLAATRAGPLPGAEAVGLASTFLLGIYGGFFSGGYVALLTAALIACFQLTFVEAIAVTKVLNLFSSLVATLIFAKQGLVDGRLGLSLSAASFAGAWLGAVLARRVSNLGLRRVFIGAVVVMALKTLVFDVPWVDR